MSRKAQSAAVSATVRPVAWLDAPYPAREYVITRNPRSVNESRTVAIGTAEPGMPWWNRTTGPELGPRTSYSRSRPSDSRTSGTRASVTFRDRTERGPGRTIHRLGQAGTTSWSASQAETVATVDQRTIATACQSNTRDRGVPPAMSIADMNWVGMASGPRRLAPGTPNRTSHFLKRLRPLDSGFAGALSWRAASAADSGNARGSRVRRDMGRAAVHDGGASLRGEEHHEEYAEKVPHGRGDARHDGIEAPHDTDQGGHLALDERNRAGEHHDDGLDDLGNLPREILETVDELLSGIHDAIPQGDSWWDS
jgi:hypothetical protein